MKKLLIAGVAAAAFCAAPAFAADMPVKAPPVAPMFNWTGFYVGATAGYGWGKSQHQIIDNDENPTSAKFDMHGAVGGGTAGINWQTGRWVLGIETDLSYSDIHGHSLLFSGNFNCQGAPCETEVDWFGTSRARIGYAWDRILPYITGGVAYAKLHAEYTPFVNPPILSGGETKTAWTFGGGIEWAIDPRWSAKIEYLHMDFGRFVYSAPITALARFDVVRVGINYKFGDPWGKSPVVAKY
jgi:outer membrane immunogenic protein